MQRITMKNTIPGKEDPSRKAVVSTASIDTKCDYECKQ